MITALLCTVSTLVVLFHVIRVAAHIDKRQYAGHMLRFVGLAGHWALISAGAVAVTVGHALGGPMLLVGLALRMVADRRREC